MNRVRGAALLLVLWLIALLTALIGAFALTARVESLQGKVLSGGVETQELARAGIEYALLRVADTEPATRWVPDGRAYRWKFAGADLEIRIVDESGKVELNQADAVLLAALMQVVGAERAKAEQVAAAIIDWRDSDAATPERLQIILGVLADLEDGRVLQKILQSRDRRSMGNLAFDGFTAEQSAALAAM